MADEEIRGLERAARADPDDFDAFRRWRRTVLRVGGVDPGELPAAELGQVMERAAVGWAAARRRYDRWSGGDDRNERVLNAREWAHYRVFARAFRSWLRVVGLRAEWDALESFRVLGVVVRDAAVRGAARPVRYVEERSLATAAVFTPSPVPDVYDVLNLHVERIGRMRFHHLRDVRGRVARVARAVQPPHGQSALRDRL